MTSEKRVQKFFTDDILLPRSHINSTEFLQLFLRHHFPGEPVAASQDVGCFLRLSKALSYSAAVLMHTAYGGLGTAEISRCLSSSPRRIPLLVASLSPYSNGIYLLIKVHIPHVINSAPCPSHHQGS